MAPMTKRVHPMARPSGERSEIRRSWLSWIVFGLLVVWGLVTAVTSNAAELKIAQFAQTLADRWDARMAPDGLTPIREGGWPPLRGAVEGARPHGR